MCVCLIRWLAHLPTCLFVCVCVCAKQTKRLCKKAGVRGGQKVSCWPFHADTLLADVRAPFLEEHLQGGMYWGTHMHENKQQNTSTEHRNATETYSIHTSQSETSAKPTMKDNQTIRQLALAHVSSRSKKVKPSQARKRKQILISVR